MTTIFLDHSQCISTSFNPLNVSIDIDSFFNTKGVTTLKSNFLQKCHLLYKICENSQVTSYNMVKVKGEGGTLKKLKIVHDMF